jgi:hypothetical protein
MPIIFKPLVVLSPKESTLTDNFGVFRSAVRKKTAVFCSL